MSEENPEYPRELGSAVQKYRRRAMASGSVQEMLPTDRKAYGEAVCEAFRHKQRQALQRELPSHRPSCTSGTAHPDGKAILAAIASQHRVSLLACPGQQRRARKPEEWEALYAEAMEEKRRLQAPKTVGRAKLKKMLLSRG